MRRALAYAGALFIIILLVAAPTHYLLGARGKESNGVKISEVLEQSYMFLDSSTILDYISMDKTGELIKSLEPYKGIIITFSTTDQAFNNNTRTLLEQFIKEYKSKTGGLVFTRVYYAELTAPNSNNTEENKTIIYVRPLAGADGVAIFDPGTIENIDKFRKDIEGRKVLAFVKYNIVNGTVELSPSKNIISKSVDTVMFDGMSIYYAGVYNPDVKDAVIKTIDELKKNKEVTILWTGIYTPTGDSLYVEDTYDELKMMLGLVENGHASGLVIYKYSIIPYPVAKYFMFPRQYDTKLSPLERDKGTLIEFVIALFIALVIIAAIELYRRRKSQDKNTESPDNGKGAN